MNQSHNIMTAGHNYLETFVTLNYPQEETDVQTELEKLDRERMLHIRELKRIQNEDSSK